MLPTRLLVCNLFGVRQECIVFLLFGDDIIVSFLPQGWRVPYFVSGMIGVIVAALAITTMTEPKRTSISEEADGDGDASSKPAARAVAQQVPVATETGADKTSIWKVLFQPKILILCVAASIRHTGTCSDDFLFQNLSKRPAVLYSASFPSFPLLIRF